MHILETGFTILGHCKALLRFWNYTFETLFYLINRMPFLIFFFNILLIMIFVYFWVSFPFPCPRPYHNHKLDFCSSPYVFLGYSSFYLGYRCFDLASQWIYISRHVYFHEHVFSFDKYEQITQLDPTPSPNNSTNLSNFLTSLIFHNPILVTS
jgi:hypothetical protein